VRFRGGAVRRRKTPVVLLSFRSVLLSVFVAALLTALTAAASPFVATAVGSEALDNRLNELSPYATGLQIDGGLPEGYEPRTAVAKEEAARVAAANELAAGLHGVGTPVLTDETGIMYAHTSAGDQAVRLMSRTDALAHVKMLAQTSGPGVYIADLTAKSAHLKPGGELVFSTNGFAGSGAPANVRLRVKGIYRALASSPAAAYWANLSQDIYPATPDDPTPPPYVFMTSRMFGATVELTGAGASGSAVGAVSGPHQGSIVEFPVNPHGLTLSGARRLERQFTAVRRTISSSAVGARLGCGRFSEGCVTLSSLSAAVLLANANVAAVKVPVSLLSDAGTAIALAVAAAAGSFLVRRRRAEIALGYARGDHVAVFAGRTAVEVLVPMLAGGAAGFALALGLTGLFAPSGSTDAVTLHAGALHAAAAVAIALVLLVGAAAVAFSRLYDTGSRSLRWLTWVPWELPVLGVAIYLLVKITSGGGLSGSSASGAAHPTLAVFVFPLLFVAAAAGIFARAARLALRLATVRAGRTRNIPIYLAVRRLAAARGLLVVLAVVTATSLGAFAYAESLAGSLDHTTAEKAYMATGSDAEASMPNEPLTKSYRYPYAITQVEFSNQNATLQTIDGVQADVMLVDPATIVAAMHWEGDWGANPAGLVARLASSPSTPLPVIVTANAGKLRAIWAAGVKFPVDVVGTVKAFPEMAVGIPLVITSYRAMAAAAARVKIDDPLGVLQAYVWGKGPPAAVERSLISTPALDAYYPSSIDTFLRDPNVLLATRTYSFMRTIAIAAAVLVLLGLLLYLQARQRSQVIASALARRMGLGAGGEALSVTIEVFAILAFAAAIGGGIAIAAAGPVVRHIDPLPEDAPAPIFSLPSGALLVAAAGLIVVACGAGALSTWFARRADVSEELRVA
jgi:putative ABC transport system permease protein